MTITPKPLNELTPAPTPMQLLDQAVSKGASVETLTGLMALQERWEKNQARKAFDTAIAAAKAEIPVIRKTEKVDFTSQRGPTRYSYEDMAGIAEQIGPILAKHGLAYRYRTSNTATAVTVICVLSHRDGHAEENSLSAGFDQTGNKNPIQALGSSVTYLQRYTLKAALGLAAADDDDGQAAGPRPYTPAAKKHRQPETGVPMTHGEARTFGEFLISAIRSTDNNDEKLDLVSKANDKLLRMQQDQPRTHEQLMKDIARETGQHD